MQVPLDTSVYVLAGMGGVLLLPQMSREPYYWTDSWIGGTNSRPAAGWKRGFKGYAFTNRPAGSKSLFVTIRDDLRPQ